MKLRQMVAAAALVLVASVAAGGEYVPAPLTVDFVNKTARGDMYTVRLSDNPSARIGCGLRNFPGVSIGFCQAKVGEAPEELVVCSTEDPALVAAIAALDDFSFITFNWDDAFNCTAVGNTTQSVYLPEFFKTTKTK